jgi:pyruvate/2-oxoglutarate dehydrogenase complex dihydrolipoamide acyltransferase (E2) component
MINIVIERETANDESGIVVAIYVRSGEPVEQDRPLFDIENSKAVQEIWSTTAGVLTHALEIGQTVGFGVPIAQIVTPEEWAARVGNQVHSPRIPETHPKPHSITTGNENPCDFVLSQVPSPASRSLAISHLSRAATALITDHHLSSTTFDIDFVTSRDVLSYLGTLRPPGILKPSADSPTQTIEPRPETGRTVEHVKTAEIEALSNGAGNTMLSVLGATIGPLTVRRTTADFLNGRITDLVIYEAARLMRKFPKLNSAYRDGRVITHEAVHAGLAIDSGSRLIVYGIENADRASLHELSATIADAVARYLENKLTSAEMSRATFTVTDLSADELDFVFPLLPRGQSCIVGITHSAQTGFRLFCGFDHRVTEGREVAAFLGELRSRLLTFGAAPTAAQEVPQCHFCGRSADETLRKNKERGLLKVVDRDGHESLSCASCWNGW